jgi:hypothetical protein
VASLSIDQVYCEFYSNVRSSLEPSAHYNQSPYEILCISKVASSSSSLVYDHVYNLNSLLHVSSNMLSPATVTIASSGLSPVTCRNKNNKGETIDKDNTLYNNNKNNSENNLSQ